MDLRQNYRGSGLGALGLTDDQLATEARIPVRILRAIRAIESGHNPAVTRFEPHIFLRLVPGAAIPYTRGPTMAASRVASQTNRAAFERARAINEQAAIKATSWGLYQVLGQHLLNIFPRDPVGSFYADPRSASDRLLISWFNSRPAASAAARALNFTELARLYNGSSVSPWGARVAAAYARGGGEGGGAALVRTSAIVIMPWLAAGTAGILALLGLAHYASKR